MKFEEQSRGEARLRFTKAMETAPPEEVKAEDELPPVPAREMSSDPMPPGPTPLEPTLSELIMVSYEGGRDDAGVGGRRAAD